MASKTTKRTATRRQILAAAPVALTAGAIPAVSAAPQESVTPALARLFEQWQAAYAEYRRLSAIYDDACRLYHRTALQIPNAIMAPLDDKGRPIHGDRHLYYAQRNLEPHPKAGMYVLIPSYWLDRGDKERARIADEFVASDIAAREGAGIKRTDDAVEAQFDVALELEIGIESFHARSFADLVVLATLAQAQIEGGRADLNADFHSSIITRLVAFAGKPTVTHVL